MTPTRSSPSAPMGAFGCGISQGLGLELVVGTVAGGCSGSMILRINDPAGVNFVAGTVVNYQGRYRDPRGVGADLSDAVEVEYE